MRREVVAALGDDVRVIVEAARLDVLVLDSAFELDSRRYDCAQPCTCEDAGIVVLRFIRQRLALARAGFTPDPFSL